MYWHSRQIYVYFSISEYDCTPNVFSLLVFALFVELEIPFIFKTGYSLVLQKQIDSFKSVSFYHRY
jgi:hypothetical protein